MSWWTVWRATKAWLLSTCLSGDAQATRPKQESLEARIPPTPPSALQATEPCPSDVSHRRLAGAGLTQNLPMTPRVAKPQLQSISASRYEGDDMIGRPGDSRGGNSETTPVALRTGRRGPHVRIRVNAGTSPNESRRLRRPLSSSGPRHYFRARVPTDQHRKKPNQRPRRTTERS